MLPSGSVRLSDALEVLMVEIWPTMREQARLVYQQASRFLAELRGDPYETGEGLLTSYEFDSCLPVRTIFNHWAMVRLRGSYRKIDPAAFRAHALLDPAQRTDFVRLLYSHFIERTMLDENCFIAYGFLGEHPRQWQPEPYIYRYDEDRHSASLDHDAAGLSAAVLARRPVLWGVALETLRISFVPLDDALMRENWRMDSRALRQKVASLAQFRDFGEQLGLQLYEEQERILHELGHRQEGGPPLSIHWRITGKNEATIGWVREGYEECTVHGYRYREELPRSEDLQAAKQGEHFLHSQANKDHVNVVINPGATAHFGLFLEGWELRPVPPPPRWIAWLFHPPEHERVWQATAFRFFRIPMPAANMGQQLRDVELKISLLKEQQKLEQLMRTPEERDLEWLQEQLRSAEFTGQVALELAKLKQRQRMRMQGEQWAGLSDEEIDDVQKVIIDAIEQILQHVRDQRTHSAGGGGYT